MDTEEFERRDAIHNFIIENDNSVSSEKICSEFFENHVHGSPEHYLKKVLTSDPRFEQDSEGNWRTLLFKQGKQCLAKERFCVFDLETTGGIPPLHRIIEIGGVILEDGKIVDEFETLLNPGRPVPDYVSRLTGIGNEELKDAPTIEEWLPKFLEFSEGCILAAHNADFDVHFLNFEAQRLLNKRLSGIHLCTLKLSKFLIRDTRAHKLEAMADYFDIKIEKRHRALGDSIMTAKLLVNLLEILKEDGKELNIDDIQKFCIRLREDYFPACLFSPEELDAISQSSGILYLKGESKKRLYSMPMKNLERDIKLIFYEGTRRTPNLKRLLKKARSVEILELNSYLNALLDSSRFQTQKVRDRDSRFDSRNHSFYLKLMNVDQNEIHLTNRRLRDEATYVGPMRKDEVESKISRDFQTKTEAFQKFPPKSGIEETYVLKNGSLKDYFPGHFHVHNKMANCMVKIPGKENEYQLIFVREGFLLKKRWVDLEKSDRLSVENIVREILKAYYYERDLFEIIGKLNQQTMQEYEIIMRWLHRDYKDDNCQVLFLNQSELQKFREKTVKRLSDSLYPDS